MLKPRKIDIRARERNSRRLFVSLQTRGVDRLDLVEIVIEPSGIEGSLAQHLRKVDIIYGQHFSDHVVNTIVENGPHLVEFLQQAVQNTAFDDRLTFFRVAGHEIERVHITLLADAVNAAKPLLQARRVPRQVVVDHQSAELEIDALACRFSRHADLLLGPKLLLSTPAFMRVHPAVNFAGRKTPTPKIVTEVLQSVAMLRKEEQFARPDRIQKLTRSGGRDCS